MNPLTQLALAGTARASERPLPGGEPFDALLAGYGDADRERALLLRAAAEDVYRRAGYVAEHGVALAPPAPDEHLAACSAAVAGLIGGMLGAVDELAAPVIALPDTAPRRAQLLPEALGLLAAARQRLPHRLLPAALGIREAERRAALRPVLGERGRWLARFNPAWSWAAETEMADGPLPLDAERLWQEGSRSRRLAILQHARAADPALARAWVAAVWRVEDADFRVDMLQVFDSAPALEDEPVLEAALGDRSSAVRERAAALLARIPGSQLAGRMRERAETMLVYTPPAPVSRLRSLVRSVLQSAGANGLLQATLPEELPKDWQRDGVASKPPAGFGQRSWWLIQTLALVAPTHWEARWEAAPAALIAAAAADEEVGPAVIEGWSRATLLHRTATWAPALYAWWSKAGPREPLYQRVRHELLPRLLGLLPPRVAEQRALEAFRQPHIVSGVGRNVLLALPRPWEASFGSMLLDEVLRTASSPNAPLLSSLDIIAYALPPACFEHALRLQSLADDRRIGWRVGPFLATIGLRQRLYQEIKA